MKSTVINIGGSLTLFIVLLVLKLTNTVAWSWWIITLPLWIAPALGLVLTTLVLVAIIACLIMFGVVFLCIWLWESIK